MKSPKHSTKQSAKQFKQRLKAISGELDLADDMLMAQRVLAASRLARGEDLTLRRLWNNRTGAPQLPPVSPVKQVDKTGGEPDQNPAGGFSGKLMAHPARYEKGLTVEQLVLPPVYAVRRPE